MTIEDLKNTKIYLSNVGDRMKFQEKVFKLGVEWNDGTSEIKYVKNCSYYYINDYLQMTRDDDIGSTYWFIGKRDKQIFLDEVLAIKEPKEECKFKPYDRVLVRDKDDQRWRPREFSWYEGDDDCGYIYECTDGYSYRQCIPYEGNEELANTTKNPEQ